MGPQLPPWGGLWSLLSPNGLPASGVADLEAQTPLTGQTVDKSPTVGVQEYPYGAELGATPPIPAGGVTFSVYAFSGDSPWQSRCLGARTLTWVPVLSSGRPTVGSGLNAHGVGVIVRPDGSHQVTYDGHPLYFYGQEAPVNQYTGTEGNGNGASAFGGTFTAWSIRNRRRRLPQSRVRHTAPDQPQGRGWCASRRRRVGGGSFSLDVCAR